MNNEIWRNRGRGGGAGIGGIPKNVRVAQRFGRGKGMKLIELGGGGDRIPPPYRRTNDHLPLLEGTRGIKTKYACTSLTLLSLCLSLSSCPPIFMIFQFSSFSYHFLHFRLTNGGNCDRNSRFQAIFPLGFLTDFRSLK